MRQAILWLTLAFSAHAQSFETASIKPGTGAGGAGWLKPAPGGLSAQNITILGCIQWAWKLEDYRIVVPPSLKESAESAHYDIVARAPEKASADDLRLMMRSLLAERFHLSVHNETKDVKVLALVVAKGGPKNLRQPSVDEVTSTEPKSRDAEAQHWVFHNADMKTLAGFLSAPGLENPVVDLTGFEGHYTFDFFEPVWNRAEGPLAEHMLGQVFPEVQRQLGFRVQGQTTPMDVLVIDRLDKSPSEN